jgi:hypothetical protein
MPGITDQDRDRATAVLTAQILLLEERAAMIVGSVPLRDPHRTTPTADDRDYLDDLWRAIDFRLQVWCQGGDWNWTEEQLGLPERKEAVPRWWLRPDTTIPLFRKCPGRSVSIINVNHLHSHPHCAFHEHIPNSLADWPYSEDNPVPTLSEWKAGKR